MFYTIRYYKELPTRITTLMEGTAGSVALTPLSAVLVSVSPVPDYVKATVETVMKIHETEDDGDVLAFLTGQVSV